MGIESKLRRTSHKGENNGREITRKTKEALQSIHPRKTLNKEITESYHFQNTKQRSSTKKMTKNEKNPWNQQQKGELGQRNYQN